MWCVATLTYALGSKATKSLNCFDTAYTRRDGNDGKTRLLLPARSKSQSRPLSDDTLTQLFHRLSIQKVK